VAQISHSKNIFVCLIIFWTRIHLIGLGLGLGLVAFGLGLVSVSFGGLRFGLLTEGLVKVAIVPTLQKTNVWG